MINNYNYFLIFAEELNISKAANRLFVSHQCLSKYLRDLETKYKVTLFIRKPKIMLTPAGEELLASLREIEKVEWNLNNRLIDIRNAKAGSIRLGTTEGRYRLLIPDLLKEYQRIYPDVKLLVYSATSPQLFEMLMNNQLDLVFAGSPADVSGLLKSEIVLDEQMYLTISDNMLKQYFPAWYPECKQTFARGADLRLFAAAGVPFILNKKGFSSRRILDTHQQKLGIVLNCINEVTQPDLHHVMSARDYAASCCLSMYVPNIRDINLMLSRTGTSTLNVFPIQDLQKTNPVTISYLKDRIFPVYGRDLISLIMDLCKQYVAPLHNLSSFT